MQKYNVKSNFLQYYSLLSAIPQEWKTMLKQECLPPSTEYVPLEIEKLTCKTINNTLLNHNKFTKWYNATCRGNIALEQNEIIYGVLKFTSSGLTLNHLIIIGNYFLYINAVQDDKRPQFTDFVILVNEKIELEKYIAIMTNQNYFLLINKTLWERLLGRCSIRGI